MSHLIKVQKAGDTLRVHPDTLEAHKAAGWAVSADQTPEKAVKEPASKTDGGQPVTAAEVLALADGNFMAFKAAAKKVLGDEAPAKKDEIVAALQAKTAA